MTLTTEGPRFTEEMLARLDPPCEEWAPRYWTKPLRENFYTRGPDIWEFAAAIMKTNKGFRAGEALEFADWQRWLCDHIFEEKEDGYLRHRRVLAGLPRKNGKSLIGTTIALERLLFGNEGTQIYSAAIDRDQAKVVFGEAVKQVKASEYLSKRIRITRDTLYNKKTGAVYRALSADGMRAQGLGPELVIVDELHAWKTDRLREFFEALSEGSGDRPESLLLAITTAGDNLESLLGEQYLAGIKLANGEKEDPTFGFFWWEADEADDPFSEETWKKANPNIAEGLMDLDDFRSSLSSASGGNINKFLRYRLNRWVRTHGEEFITPFHWNKIKDAEARIPLPEPKLDALGQPVLDDKGEPVIKKARITVGFDGSLSDDSTGFVGIDLDTGVIEVLASWHKDDNDPHWAVPRAEVLAAKDRIFRDYDVQLMYVDQAFFQSDVQEWAEEHYPKIQNIPQSVQRMGPMTQQFKLDVISGHLTHAGDSDLSEHIQNAVEKETGMIRKERRGSPKKIDLAVCAILANGARHFVLTEPEEEEIPQAIFF